MSLRRSFPSHRVLRTWLLPVYLLLLFGASSGDAGLVAHFGEPATVGADEEASAVAVFGDDARVAGTVHDFLLVVDGRADISGAVLGDVVVVDGVLALAPGARVSGDVTLFGSTVSGTEAAVIGGAVTHDPTFEVGRAAALFWWTSSTLALVALALAVVALVGLQPRVVRAGAARPGRSLLVGLAIVAVAPLVALLAFMTGIGLGVGLLILAALPGLLLAGYVVAGLAVGVALFNRTQPDWGARPWGPYAAAALGVIALQVIWVVPFLGLVSALAAVTGVGALALGAFDARLQTQERWSVRSDLPPALSVS